MCVYINLFTIVQPLFGLSGSGRVQSGCCEIRDTVLRYSWHAVTTFRGEYTCLQRPWYSSDWKQSINKLLVFATRAVYLKSKKNASVLTWLRNLGKEMEMCVVRERDGFLMGGKDEK